MVAFGTNEWLVDEIYQQYLKDPQSVDRAWWDFFADYRPGEPSTLPGPTAGTVPDADAAAASRPIAGPLTVVSPATTARTHGRNRPRR
jgi:multifunctional 2-oxoglutarate metabolism enzyme